MTLQTQIRAIEEKRAFQKHLGNPGDLIRLIPQHSKNQHVKARLSKEFQDSSCFHPDHLLSSSKTDLLPLCLSSYLQLLALLGGVKNVFCF